MSPTDSAKNHVVKIHDRYLYIQVRMRSGSKTGIFQYRMLVTRGEPLHPPLLGPALEEVLAGPLLLVLHEPGRHQLPGEAFQVVVLQPVRLELVLEPVAHLLQRVLAVEQLEDEVLLLVEPVVPQADGVLDDVERLALVLLLEDLQVRAHLQPHRLAALGRVVEVLGQVHG